MIEVKQVTFDDLTTDEQDVQPNNGSGKEYASYLKVAYSGNNMAIYSDAMEPEDAYFSRDLKWISKAIEAAYAAGVLESWPKLKERGMACKLRCPSCKTMCKERGDDAKKANGQYDVISGGSETVLHCRECGAYRAVSLWKDE